MHKKKKKKIGKLRKKLPHIWSVPFGKFSHYVRVIIIYISMDEIALEHSIYRLSQRGNCCFSYKDFTPKLSNKWQNY